MMPTSYRIQQFGKTKAQRICQIMIEFRKNPIGKSQLSRVKSERERTLDSERKARPKKKGSHSYHEP